MKSKLKKSAGGRLLQPHDYRLAELVRSRSEAGKDTDFASIQVAVKDGPDAETWRSLLATGLVRLEDAGWLKQKFPGGWWHPSPDWLEELAAAAAPQPAPTNGERSVLDQPAAVAP